jgi:RNA methyltransferase, TrmH family
MSKNSIISAQNPKIKQVISLRRAARRKKNDLIMIEGRRELGMAVSSGVVIASLFYCPACAGAQTIPKKIDPRLICEVGPEIFKKISLREHPDGFLALARPRYFDLTDIKLSDNPLLVIAETLEKPGNLGAIFRTADAAGANAVILCDPQTDLYNPNVIRASQGTVFSVPSAVCTSKEAIGWLKRNKIKIFCATPQAEKIYTEIDFTGPSAIAIGAEHAGLSEEWLDAVHEKIRIPMRGAIDSLNASVSLAVILFEALRQKK